MMVFRAFIAFAVWSLSIAGTAFAQSGDDDVVVKDPRTAAKLETKFLSGTRQLTFEGRRAGEGYFM